jgi:hypothetical protein
MTLEHPEEERSMLKARVDCVQEQLLCWQQMFRRFGSNSQSAETLEMAWPDRRRKSRVRCRGPIRKMNHYWFPP